MIEAVTGTGKTMVGVAAAMDELGRRGQVVVLVPTVELQHQWCAELTLRLPGGVPIGRLGDGATDTLQSHDIVVAVVNSARAADLRPIRRGGLLVADECHRYGSDVNRLALDERFTRRLGLSATYAREDDGHLAWLDPYFGGTCFQMGYRRAVLDEVTAHFSVALVGVAFSHEERCRYDELTDELGMLVARLVARCAIPAEPFEAFLRAIRRVADSGQDDDVSLARRLLAVLLERRRLLADTPAKLATLPGLVGAIRAAERTVVFTQSIAVSEQACEALGAWGFRAGVVHSGLAGSDRRATMRRFASGDLDVIAAPRLLDEGIDVPAADLGVILAASRSRRQMVQRMGRVLRRKPDGRLARFAVVFVEHTVEDPATGAHESFLEEITDVADAVRVFRSGADGVSAASHFLARYHRG